MVRTIRVLAAAVILAAPGVAAAQTLTLSPSTGWHSERNASRCSVSRVFGDGARRHILIMEQFYPDDRLNMTLAGPAFERFTDDVRAQIDLTDGRASAWATPLRGEVEGYGPGFKLSGIRPGPVAQDRLDAERKEQTALPRISAAALQPSEFVTFAQRGRKVRLQTGALDGALAALDACTHELAASWGLEVDRLREASAAPQWENRGEIRNALGDLFQGYWKHWARPQGIVHLRVTVNEQGHPEDCRAIAATGDLPPSDGACQIMQKARFTPARDAQGQPVRAFYATSFRDYRHMRSGGILIGVE